MKMRLSDSIKKWAIAAAAAALLVWCAADIDWSTLNYFSWGTFRATIANLCKPDFAAFYTGSSEDIFHLMLLTVGLLIAASFLPQPGSGVLRALYELRSGLVCMGLCLFGVVRACLRAAPPQGLPSEALSRQTGLSVVTVRRYVNYLVERGEAASAVNYDTGGRPCRLYRCPGPPA